MSNMIRRNALVLLVMSAWLGACADPERQPRAGGPRPPADLVEGERLLGEGRYHDAEACLRRAHDAEPRDTEVLDALTRARLLVSGGQDQPEELRRGRALAVEREERELERLLAEGEALLASDVSGAIARFERVLERLRWFPYPIGDPGWKERAEARLMAARSGRLAPPRAPRAATPEPELPTSPDFLAGLRHYEAFGYRKAAELFRRARDEDPSDEVIQRYLLQAELLCGERRSGCSW